MSDDNGSNGAMQVDTDLVRQLAEMLNSNDLTEIEVEDGDRRIVVKRQLTASLIAQAPMAAAASPAAPPPPPPAPPAPPPPAEDVSPANHPGSVKSPMVGTAFLSGQPGAPPFVTVGATVAPGDTLLIVEAMKVMNPITAPKGGTVRHILVQDNQPVEYDQPLVIIE